MGKKRASVVIVGRPNVGKSTLFNKLTGTRRSIVTDEPGITRDRIYGTAEWEGKKVEVVDTGGIVPDEKAMIPREILRQARVAIEAASQLVLVVDARAGITPLDEELARMLRRTGKPLVIAANKVDTQGQEAQAAAFYKLGPEVVAISAEHGAGVDDLLDRVTAGMEVEEEESEEATTEENTAALRPVSVAILGRPNVGKSTMLNRLVGEERAIVSPVAGTTRDAVDTMMEREGRSYRFVDTAGIRKKSKTKLVAEKLSVVMARKNLEEADVALVVCDAEEGVTSGDATIADYAEQSGRGVIVVLNKWDLAVKAMQRKAAEEGEKPMGAGELMREYEALVRKKLKFVAFAPVVFMSALTGERIGQIFGLIDRVGEAWRRRIPTRELNQWLATVDLEKGTSPASRQMKIYYATQAGTAPPTILLFTNQKRDIHFSYQRFLENLVRKRWDFMGTPIRFVQRVKERKARTGRGKKKSER